MQIACQLLVVWQMIAKERANFGLKSFDIFARNKPTHFSNINAFVIYCVVVAGS